MNLHEVFRMLDPSMAAKMIDAATARPVVVTDQWFNGERTITRIQVHMPLPGQPIDDDVPDDAQSWKRDVLPAHLLDTMRPENRQAYREQYRAFLMWRKAHALGMRPADLAPWVEYDPAAIDEDVLRWLNPTTRYAGD